MATPPIDSEFHKILSPSTPKKSSVTATLQPMTPVAPVVGKPTRRSVVDFSVPKSTDFGTKRLEVAYDSRGRHVVGMDPNHFLEMFMPYNETTTPAYRGRLPKEQHRELLRSVAKAGEKTVYKKFIAAFQGYPYQRKHRSMTCVLKFYDNHAHRDPDAGNMGVDIGVASSDTKRTADLYASHAEQETHVELKSFGDPFVDTKDQPDAMDAEDLDNDDNDDAEIVTAQSDDADPPSGEEDEDYTPNTPQQPARSLGPKEHFPPTPLSEGYLGRLEHQPTERDTVLGINTRGQICIYAAATMALQFRFHLFTIVTFRRFARFIRWDRSCSIVSRRFDYDENPDLFFEYFKRLSQLTRAQRGLDIHVSIPSAAEQAMAQTAFQAQRETLWKNYVVFNERNSKPPREPSVWKMNVQSEDGHWMDILVGSAYFRDGLHSPFGRATRTTVALTLNKDHKVVLFKDYARHDYPHTVPELDVYRMIKKALEEDRVADKDTPTFCTLLGGGDAAGEQHPNAVLELAGVNLSDHPQIRRMRCHRIVLEEVCLSLHHFLGAKDLFNLTADAAFCLQWLYDRLKILHRDFSPDNVLIVTAGEARTGALIDFDSAFCLEASGSPNDHRAPGRSGKWPYLSANLAEKKRSIHENVDDLESVFHSLVRLSLRRLPTNLTPANRWRKIQILFDGYPNAKYEYMSMETTNDYHECNFQSPGVTEAVAYLHGVLQANYPFQPPAKRFLEPEKNYKDGVEDRRKEYELAKQHHLNDVYWIFHGLRKHAASMHNTHDSDNQPLEPPESYLMTNNKRTITESLASDVLVGLQGEPITGVKDRAENSHDDKKARIQ